MPFAENNGVKIYFEIHGQGHPIVLMHGFTGNLQVWKLAGYVSGLEKSHRVILIDERGHGQSDKPHDAEAYSLDKRLEDIIIVLDRLGVEQASFFGYSRGGRLALAQAAYFPERVVSLVIGGAHPFQESVDDFTAVDGSDPDAFIHALSSFIGEEITPEFQPIIVHNDLVALSAAARDRQSFGERLSHIQVPCLLFVGESDERLEKVNRCATKLPNARLLMVPSAGHVTAILKVDVVLPAVVGFFEENLAGKTRL
jgi:pimeloyl-ACP methyl ester carboxylesterase